MLESSPMSAAVPVLERVECVVGPEWAAALAGASSTAHLQAALARPDLWLEAQLLEKLLYKNANQHRGAQHFQRLHEVRRLLGLLRSQQLDRRVGALHEALAAAQQRGSLPRGSVLMAYGGDQRSVPSHQAAAGVLRTLVTACQLIEQLARAVQRASLQLLAQLAHSFFMPLCLTALAALARIQVLAGQLLLDAVRAYNTLAEVAALLPPTASDDGASVAVAAAPTVEGGTHPYAVGREALPQLLRAQWRRGLPCLEPVPCPAGDGLAVQAAAACDRYALHVVCEGSPAAPASAVVLEEQPAAAEAAGGAPQRRGKQRSKQAGTAAPVLAVVEDRGVPISRDAFAAAAGKAAVAAPAAAETAAAPEPAPVAAAAAAAAAAGVPLLPLLGVVEDSAPEVDAAGTVASLMEGEARGHLYRRAAAGLGPLASQPRSGAKRQKADPLGQNPAGVPPALRSASQGATLLAAAAPREQQPAAAQPAQAAALHQVSPAVAAPAGVGAAPDAAAAPAVRPAFVPVAAAAAPKPAFLSVAVAAAPANTTTLHAPVTACAAPKQASVAAGAGGAATTAAAGSAAQPAGQTALGGPARKRKRPSAATAAAEQQQQQQQQQPALAEPKSWEDWLQPLGGGAASGATAGAPQQTQAGTARRQQGKRRSGR